LQRNLEHCGLDGVSRVLPLTAAKALARLAAEGEQFSLIFLDPPYGYGIPDTIVPVLLPYNLIAPEGQVVVEHSSREILKAGYDGLTRIDQRRYGTTMVSFYTVSI
jgi:16S rRNA G966 N2-methylase RsmD